MKIDFSWLFFLSVSTFIFTYSVVIFNYSGEINIKIKPLIELQINKK
jgi:hypothetical protein